MIKGLQQMQECQQYFTGNIVSFAKFHVDIYGFGDMLQKHAQNVRSVTL